MIDGVLLTGGRSSRMGVDKATLVVGGETLAARAARVLLEICDRVVEVGPGVTGLACTRENPPGGGPGAALLAGVRALATDGPVVLLACDLPFVDAALLELIASWPGHPTAVPVAREEPQFVCARYGPNAFAEMVAILRTGGRSLRRALAATDHDVIPESIWTRVAPAHALDDVDTPDDLTRLGLS